jgi:hypothetical protein
MAMHNQVHVPIRGSFASGVVGNFGQVEHTLCKILDRSEFDRGALLTQTEGGKSCITGTVV